MLQAGVAAHSGLGQSQGSAVIAAVGRTPLLSSLLSVLLMQGPKKLPQQLPQQHLLQLSSKLTKALLSHQLIQEVPKTMAGNAAMLESQHQACCTQLDFTPIR